jgi:hypothetical protein
MSANDLRIRARSHDPNRSSSEPRYLCNACVKMRGKGFVTRPDADNLAAQDPVDAVGELGAARPAAGISISNVLEPNHAPAFTSRVPLNALVGVAYTYQLSAHDPDGDALVFAATRLPPAAVFDPSTRLLSWTPMEAGYARFIFTVTDPSGARAAQDLTLIAQRPNVNPAPLVISAPLTYGLGYEAFRP